MARCEICGSALQRTRIPEFRTENLGIPVVLVRSAWQTVCPKCKKVTSITIPDMEGLISAIAVSRVKLPNKLNGTEIRFLRKALRLNGSDFGDLLNVTKESVSRWENDKEPIGASSEKLLRISVGLKMSDQAPAINFDPALIIDMKIKPVRSVNKPIVMHFGRITLKKDNKKKDHWDETDRKVA